MEGGELLEVF